MFSVEIMAEVYEEAMRHTLHMITSILMSTTVVTAVCVLLAAPIIYRIVEHVAFVSNIVTIVHQVLDGEVLTIFEKYLLVPLLSCFK